MAKKNLVPASQQQLDANAWLARINDLPDEQAQEEERSGVRAVADTAVQFGKGAVSGVRMMSDVFGADNAVSGGLRTVDDALNGLLSATAKQDQQQVAAILQEAEGKGWMEQIGLGLKAAGVAPGALLAQAAGTAIPTMAAALIPGALPARLAAGAMGAAQGVGTTKGSIYETVKNELLKSDATQEEAEARAVEAQSYGGDNSGQIALGGGLGILAGTTGMEKAIHGLRSGVTKAAPGLTGRMTMGGLVEAGPETLQGGQEKYATNTALANEGFQVDPMSGVAANATMEGVAGAGMGAAFGIPNPSVTPGAPAAQETPPVAPTLPADQLRATKIPENGPMTAAVNAGIESKAQEIESLAEKSARIRAAIEPIIQQRKEQNDAAELADLVESERRDKQVMLAQMDMERQKQAEIDAAFEAKPALEAQQRAATLDAPSAMQQAFQQASQADQVAAVPSPVTQAPEPRIVERTPDMKPMPLELAELQVEMDGGEVVRTQNRNGKYAYHVIKEQAKPKAAPVVEEKPDQANVIKNNLGKPFTNLFAANNAASKAGAGWSVVKVGKNAFEVHRNEQNTAQGTDTTPAKAPGEAPQAVAGDAATVAGVPAAGAGSVEGIWLNTPVAQTEQAQVATDGVATNANNETIERLKKDAKLVNLGQVSDEVRAQMKSAIDAAIVSAVSSNVPEEDIFNAIQKPGDPARNISDLLPNNTPAAPQGAPKQSRAQYYKGITIGEKELAFKRKGEVNSNGATFDYTKFRALGADYFAISRDVGGWNGGQTYEVVDATGLLVQSMERDGKSINFGGKHKNRKDTIDRFKTLTDDGWNPKDQYYHDQKQNNTPAATAPASAPTGLNPNGSAIGKVSFYSISSEKSGDGRLTDSELISNLSKRKSAFNKGLDNIDSNTRSVVQNRMLRISHKPEILKSVIELIPIDVVNALALKQLTPEMLFHNPSMLFNLGVAGNGNYSIPLAVDAPFAFVKAIANFDARDIKGIDGSGLSTNDGAAGAKIDGKHVVTPSSNDVPGAGSASTQPAPPTVSKNSSNVNANGVTQQPESGGFDSKAWNKKRDDTIKESRKSGAVHLDSVTPSVESMRGREIYNVHDPKEKGVIRTVDNNGNVYVQWSDDYSGKKNSASETEEPNKSWLKTTKSQPIWKKAQGGKTLVLQTSLGTTDLKDYVFGAGEATQAAPKTLQEGIAQVRAKKAKDSQPQGTPSEKATEAQPAQVESAVLPPELSAKLQEAHKAHGRDVTQAKVQKAYDRTLNEVLTGTGNNGGVKYKIKPIQMAELKRKLNRLENDLSLFGIQPTGTTNEPQTSVAQQTSQEGSQPQGTAVTTDKPATDSGVAATGEAEVANPTNTDVAPDGWNEAAISVAAQWDKSDRGQKSYLAEKAGMGKRVYGKDKKTLTSFSWDEMPPDAQRTMVVARLNKTDVNPVAPSKPKKKPAGARNLRKGAYEKNPLLTFLATHGLYHEKDKPNSMKSEFSPDKTIMIAGYGPIFKRTGKDYSSLVPMAIEDGYLPQGGTASELYDLIHRAVGGEKIVPMYAEGVADQVIEQAFADHLAQQQEAAQDEDYDPFDFADELGFTEDDADIAGYDEALDPIKLEVNALLAKAQELGIDTDALKEDAYYATADQSEQDNFEYLREAASRAIKEAIEGSNRDSSANAGSQGNAGDEEGVRVPTEEEALAALESYTPADVLATQARAEQAAKAEAKADQEAEAKAKAERIAKEIQQRQEASAENFQLGQSAEESLSGQGGLFANEPTASYNNGYEADLFGNPLPEPTGKNRAAKPANKRVPGGLQPTTGIQDTIAPPGEYYVTTIVGSESNRSIGTSRVTTAEQAAQATSYLYKSAVERFDGIITDKSGKPLAVIGGFKGALSQASVYPATLMGEAIRIPGAAKVWFSHNHPSGNTTLSDADRRLNTALADVFRGSGIEPMGLMAVSNGRYSFVDHLGYNEESGGIPAPTSSASVPVIERHVGKGSPTFSITDPAAAKVVAKSFYDKKNEPGILLLNVQNQVVGWVPITKELSGPLRDTGGSAAIYRAVSESNAGSAIIVHGGELDYAGIGNSTFGKVTPSENIAAALYKVDVRPLDSINTKTGKSVAEKGIPVAKGPMFSRTTQIRNQLDKAISAVADLKALTDGDGAIEINELYSKSKETRDAKNTLIAELAALPDDYFGLQAKTTDGRLLTLNASAREPGMWQLTRFDKNGEPWGDTNYKTKAQAIDEFVAEADLRTLESPDAMFSRSKRPVFSRGAQTQANAEVSKIIDAIRANWDNAPEIVVAFDMQDPIIPERVRQEDQKQRSQYELNSGLNGAKGSPVSDEKQLQIAFIDPDSSGNIGARQATLNEISNLLNIPIDHSIFGATSDAVDGRTASIKSSVNSSRSNIQRLRDLLHGKSFTEKSFSSLDVKTQGLVLTDVFSLSQDRKILDSIIQLVPVDVMNILTGGKFSPQSLFNNEAVFRNRLSVVGGVTVSGQVVADTLVNAAALSSAVIVDANNIPTLAFKHSPATDALYRNNGHKTSNMYRESSRESIGKARGFYYKGKVYLIASELQSTGDVVETLFHETLGHYGLRGHFGGALKPILQQIVTFRKALVEAKMKEYGLRNVSNMDRLVASEEVLAEMAQNTPEIGFVKRAIAAIRNWLRSNVPGFQSMKMTDNDIIQQFILPARAFVERGQGKAGGGAMFSRSTVSGYTKHATDKLNEAFNHPGTLSMWHKTVGSMYNLAERSTPFKRVFDAAQSFIQDVSFYATEAADLAPKILPKLDTWKDMLKTPVSSEDNKAISAPILQGTLSWARNEAGEAVRIEVLEEAASNLKIDQKSQRLLRGDHISEGVLKMWRGLPIEQYEAMIESKFKSSMLKPGIVFTDAELVKHFSLNKDQISLYREFRSATDKSLDNLAKADLLRFGGKDVEHLRDMVMDAATADDAAVMLRDDLHSQRDLMPDRADDLTAAANGMMDRADKVNKLKKEGYAPLSRFGRYSVDVVVDGERQYFSLFESKQAANQMAMKLKAEFGAANVAQGTMSQKDFEQFQGITPESLELFGNMLGLDSTGNEAQDKAFQTYLKLTKSNRSAMKRMIHRKGTTGFSEDIGRVLAAFVYSNARQTSAALHMGELGEAVNDIPKGQGELKDAAIELSDYIKKPREEAQALRGMLFAQYLGGSVASAFVNFTQPLTISFPYLSQFGGAAKSGAALVQAMKDQRAGKVLEAGLDQALRKAEEEGIVSPQSVHELMAQAQGRSTLNAGDGTRLGDAKAFAQNNFAKLTIGWGKLFGLAEQINRRSTFIAAYRIAVDQKIANPGAFATKAVNETQFISNKANKAKFGRGAIGATLMTFKSYSINYLELLHRMATQNGPEGKKAAALMLGMLFLMAGAGGLPFDDDLEDLADFLAQRLGYNFSSKKAKQEFLENLFGKAMAQFIDKGISGIPGSPIDTSGRMSMGNMIPGTGLLLTKRDHTGDLKELAGPVGDLIQRGFQGADKLLSGDVSGAAKAIAPKAVYNALKGADMAGSGAYNDDKGYKVISSTPFEAAMKAIGFQPASVAEVQQSNYLNQRAKDFYSIKSQAISAKWAKGIYEKDDGQIADAKKDIAEWNEENPDQRMRPNMPAIIKRVREMRKDKAQRIADTAPKAMRAQMKRDLAPVE